MTFEFKLPDLGEGITEGEIVKWRVKPGDEVAEHQAIVDIETDKAIVEVPSPRKGKILKLNKAEGEAIKVGETIVFIEAPEEIAKASRPSMSVVGSLPDEDIITASPKARTLAKKLSIDISKISGTGPGGVVTEKDVLGANVAAKATEPSVAQASDKSGLIERVPIKGVRKAITKNLLASKNNTAFVTGMDDADVTELWALRAREQKAAKEKGLHLTFLPFFIKAVQHALQTHPMLNGSVDEEREEIVVKKYFNTGVAVDTPDGLMVPVVKDVNKKTILELAAELQELSKKARERKITLEELKGSTFTISNYGSFGGTYATPIINYPDVAILGTGKIGDRPWVKDGKIVIRKILPLSLTFDHRVVDGVEAAAFLTKVIAYLEDPAMIFIESM
jgi:pyruvate dehydrogenase E2 component (dihydrolipoamide acetyltransferase)